MTSKDKTALLIVGHGSTVNPDSSAPTWTHAREIQRRQIFADVRCAFWKEEPSLRDARFFFADEIRDDEYLANPPWEKKTRIAQARFLFPKRAFNIGKNVTALNFARVSPSRRA